MKQQAPPPWASPSEAERIARAFPSYRDFVDDALFHPRWGYYGSGGVEFGHGAHFDTFPLALSPFFGRMLAQYAHRLWRREGAPRGFEVCEIGGGNGQLCADTLLWIWERARHEPSWKRFASAFRYRIIERSAALIERQRQLLASLAERVVWTRAELTAARGRRSPFGEVGLVFANEVLDCQAHHKIVASGDGPPGVVYVVPRLAVGDGRRRARSVPITRPELDERFGDQRIGAELAFEEILLPLRTVPGLEPFLRRHRPDLFAVGSTPSTAFACPRLEPLVRNAGRLYSRGEVLWIDYGEDGSFHRACAPSRRVFAGHPGSGRTVYDAPGRDDISFLVDFTVVAEAGRRAGLAIEYYGPQAELARRSGVRFDQRAAELIVRTRVLGWVLAVMGVGPERWRRGAFGWGNPTASEVAVRDYVRGSIAEFRGRKPNQFKLMIMRISPSSALKAGRGSRAPREARARRSSRGAGP